VTNDNVTNETDPTNLSGSYVLNGLSADEAVAFEAHVAQSDAARYEVTELRDTAVLLGLAVDPVAPPASLKASILSQLDATPQLAPEPTFASFAGPAERKARARWMSRPLTALASAAAVIALLIGGGLVTTAITQTTERQAQADRLAEINAASDVQRTVAELEGGSATLVWSAQMAQSALIVDGLEPLPIDRVFQLWYIDEAGPRSAGTFTMPASGETWQVLEGELRAGDVVGVTIEPRGGSEAPTTDPVLVIARA
jgi:anti-sigma-K factor RskA